MHKNREFKFRIWARAWKPPQFVNLKELKIYANDNYLDAFHYVFESNLFIPQQYTGLKDKNGREIYEGDIVKYKYIYEFDKESESTRVVEFYKGSFCPLPVDHIEDGDDFYSIRIKDYEIIGNIFENQELLNENRNS